MSSVRVMSSVIVMSSIIVMSIIIVSKYYFHNIPPILCTNYVNFDKFESSADLTAFNL